MKPVTVEDIINSFKDGKKVDLGKSKENPVENSSNVDINYLIYHKQKRLNLPGFSIQEISSKD